VRPRELSDPPLSTAAPRLVRPSRLLLWGGLALVAAVAVYAIAQWAAPRTRFDLTDPRVAPSWLSAAAGVQITPQGLAVPGDSAGLLTSPEPGDESAGLARLRWRWVRFVAIDLAPAPATSSLALVWIPGGDAPVQRMLVTIPAGASRVVADTQRRRPWLGGSGWVSSFPADGAVWRMGLAFRGQAVVRAVTLQALPSPRDLVALAWDDLATAEPVLASSINFHYGPSMVGLPLSVAFGALAAILGLVALARRGPATARRFFVGSLILLVLFDLTVFRGLADQVRSSRAVSAWHASRYEEYRSRFGEPFARLDALVRERVPRGTAIMLPDPPSAAAPRNTNWLWFLYQGEYANQNDRARDNRMIAPGTRFVVYDQPRLWVYEPGPGLLRHRLTGEAITVAPVASVSDSVMLLRVVP